MDQVAPRWDGISVTKMSEAREEELARKYNPNSWKVENPERYWVDTDPIPMKRIDTPFGTLKLVDNTVHKVVEATWEEVKDA